METLKSNWIATSLLSILFLVLVLFVANATEPKETPKKEKALTTVTFRYEAPTGVADPYDKTHVENTANWKPATPTCSQSLTPNAPCSMEVPLENTLDEAGEEIDPELVTINTTSVGSNRYIVAAPNPGEYQNQINALLP